MIDDTNTSVFSVTRLSSSINPITWLVCTNLLLVLAAITVSLKWTSLPALLDVIIGIITIASDTVPLISDSNISLLITSLWTLPIVFPNETT